MKKYANTTEETLITFQISGGGGNRRKVEFCDQDMTIDSYTDSLFTSFENQREIARKIGDRENLKSLFENAIDGNNEAITRIEKVTGIAFGKEVYTDCNGNEVGLDVQNDGTGVIDEDGDYDTTIVCRLQECSDEQLELIYKSNRFVSSDVREYCRAILVEKNMIFDEEE